MSLQLKNFRINSFMINIIMVCFQVAIFTLNGTYLGIRSVKNGYIQLCPNTFENLNAAWSFGTAYQQSVSYKTCYIIYESVFDNFFM